MPTLTVRQGALGDRHQNASSPAEELHVTAASVVSLHSQSVTCLVNIVVKIVVCFCPRMKRRYTLSWQELVSGSDIAPKWDYELLLHDSRLTQS